MNNLRGNNAALLAIARRRNELKRSEVAARENKVTLMRKYRTGELPDVQRVTVAAFLAPLGEPTFLSFNAPLLAPGHTPYSVIGVARKAVVLCWISICKFILRQTAAAL